MSGFDLSREALECALRGDLLGMQEIIRRMPPDEVFALDEALTELTEAVDTRILSPGLFRR